jgi:hypothetical protein
VPEVVSPTAALTTGEVTDNNKVTKANEKQYENIDEYTKAKSEAFTQRTDGIEKFANIGVQLLNGLEGTRKGGGGQRIIKKIAGIGSIIQDTIGFLTTETANKPYVEKFQGVFDAGSDILDDESGLIVGTWDQFKLTEDAPLWADLKQVGLTDLQELNTLAFNLAIASLRAKGIEDRGITNQKIALEMQSLGFGGDTMANEDAVAGLKTFLGLAVDDYDRYNRDLFNKAPIMTITDSTYVPGKGNIYGGNVSKRRRVNPWVVNGFATEVVGTDGMVTYESLGQLTPFDTNPIKERLGTNITPLGTNIGPGGTVKVRVNDDPEVITGILMQQPDTFKKAPLLIPTPQTNPNITIPTGLTSYGEMAVSFANKRTAIHKKHIANGKQPRTKEYNAAMSRDLEGLFVEYALNYFGEEALVPGTNTPARLAFEEWWNFVNTVPLSGETK